MIRVARILCLVFASLAWVSNGASALPMTPEECDRVQAERTGLESAGVTSDMAQGADWAKSNLPPDRLRRVARWIELQEQSLFRCPLPKPPKESETALGKDTGAGQEGQKPPKVEKRKTAPKPALKPAVESGDVEDREPKPVKPKTPIKKKPDVADAYKPPAPYSGDDLQHVVPGLSVPAAGGNALAP